MFLEIVFYNKIMKRLQKLMSENGIASRRKSEELILEGKVKINGQVVKKLGTKVSDKDIIEVNGIEIRNVIKEYYLLYKPKNVISTTKDEFNRRTVVDLIESKNKIYPVGRLDYDTTGIILLTNDGELTNILTQPKNNVEKEYLAKVKGYFKKEDAISLSSGIYLNKQMTKKAIFKLKKYDKNTDVSYIKIILIEGKNHQVKEMLKLKKYEVLKLKRIRFAFLTLDNLRSGEYRKLTLKEVRKLYNLK